MMETQAMRTYTEIESRSPLDGEWRVELTFEGWTLEQHIVTAVMRARLPSSERPVINGHTLRFADYRICTYSINPTTLKVIRHSQALYTIG